MQDNLGEDLLAPFLEPKNWGDIRYFRGIPLDVLQKLIDHRFVEMEPWNECRGVAGGFLPFMRWHPGFLAHGYVVPWDRKDSRITIEGIEKTALLTNHEIIDFTNCFRDADDFEVTDDYARCWYD